jgi:hypothetical protein
MPAAARRRAAAALLLGALQVIAVACSSGPAGDAKGAAAAANLAPSPAVDALVIEWRPRAAPALAAKAAAVAGAERVSIGRGGLWIGPGNGRRALYLFARRQRGAELANFARAYAPFRTADVGGDLEFRGRGAMAAGAAERRMIAEWTRVVAVEAGGDGSRVPYGLAFAWHRGAAIGGVCDDLSVYLSGEVDASSCGGVETAGRLSGERLARLYGWVDGLEPFQAAGEQGLRADSLLERLIFAGRGKRQAAAEEVAAIEAFAGTIHHELAMTAGAAPASAKAGPTPSEAAAASEAAAGPVAPPPAPPRRAPEAASEKPDAAGTQDEAEDAPPPPSPPPAMPASD